MSTVKKTSETIEGNYAQNNAYLYIGRKSDATGGGFDWKTKNEIYWKQYQIKEIDMRVKTATFTTPQYLDLTTGVYCVLITTKMHGDFGGEILDVNYDEETGLYEYKCQDFTRDYQGKFEIIMDGKMTTYRVLQTLVTRGGVSPVGKLSSKLKKQYKKQLSGLLPAYQYNQKYWGNGISKNFMEQKPQLIIRNKSYIEAIRDLTWADGSYIDIYTDKYGVLHLEPYHSTELYKNGLYLTTPEIASRKFQFDTTNIITGVQMHSIDKSKVGKYWTSKSLINLDLSAFFGNLSISMDNPNANASSGSSNNSNGSSDKKKSTDTAKEGNPYDTKNKEVYLTSDNINGKSSDKKFMEDIAKLLKKEGWKTHVGGVGPNEHYSCKVKNGVWFMIFGGADAALFKQCGGSNAFTKRLKQMNSRCAIGMHGGGDIRKGGKYYEYLVRAHDDNYSPISFKGLSHPLNYLTKNKVSIMYAGSAKDMVAKFLKGGDNPEAL